MGVEPTRGCPQWFLRPPRLPFRHYGAHVGSYYTVRQVRVSIAAVYPSSDIRCCDGAWYNHCVMLKDDLSSPAPRKSRRFLKPIIAGITCLLVAGIWLGRYRGTGWTNAVNPFYWYHRMRGDDLYHADQAVLLHGNRSIPEVVLTFDDGPHPESWAAILDILAKEQIHATFFVVGVNMAAHPDLEQATLAQGSEIANHSQDHAHRLDEINGKERRREINDADITFASITGKHLTLLRPPGMRYNDDVLHETQALGYIVVGYTTASRDFDPNETPAIIAQRTLSRTENGSIILLHDYAATAAALPDIIRGLKSRGLRCVTVSEMLKHLPGEPRISAEQFQKSHAD